MSRLSRLPEKDLERLSAFLDGDLSPREAGALEARLHDDENLRAGLAELRQLVTVVRDLPQVRPPRSFTLRPEALGRRSSATYPILRFATVVASVLFVLTTILQTAPLRNFALGAQAPMPPAAPAAEVAAEDSLSMQAPAEPTTGKFMGTPVPEGQVGAGPPTETPTMAPTEAALRETMPATDCPECPATLASAPEGIARDAESEQALRSVEVPSSPAVGLGPLQWALGFLAVLLLALTLRYRRRR